MEETPLTTEQPLQTEAPVLVSHEASVAPPPPPRRSSRTLLLVLLAFGALLAFGIYEGITSRAKADTDLRHATTQLSVPTVDVAKPVLQGGAQEVVIPGNMQAFVDTPIWARSSGYLKSWYVDIGAHVKAGQLLAIIESPETDQQLQQAREELSTAQANLKLAQITAARYTDLYKTDSVAKQEVDNAVQDAAAKAATVNSAQANVGRLQQLVGFERILAPFDGVITQRNTDVGALIDAGTNTPGKELFHLSSTSTLRVYAAVPEVYQAAAQPGVTANLTLAEFPGRQFHGMIVRNAKAIDPASRTLLVEVDVKNPTGELLPGSYVSVHLNLPSKLQAMTVPVSALLFRSEGLQVGVVRNGRTELQHVIMGRDFGETVELLSGIQKDDQVIVNPPDSIVSGQQVQINSSRKNVE
jgi:RND family efflux transporter MFP subunit